MAYNYKILPTSLHVTATAAIEWFETHWGLRKKAIQLEQAIAADIELRPTFSVQTRDFHTLCIEVSEKAYASYLDKFVLDCVNKGLPVKLFVAIPKDTKYMEYAKDMKVARQRGVGVIEVDGTSGTVLQNALSLSLSGLRTLDVNLFPKRYRENLTQADQTFRDGSPDKACALVYDEIESLFRKMAAKMKDKGWWTPKNVKKVAKVPWARVIKDVDDNLDRTKCPCKGLTCVLMAQIYGITGHRNDSGHKPNSQKNLIKRDTQLRTRFESAVDLFQELVNATTPMRL